MTLKIRFEGLPEDVANAIERLKENFDIYSTSRQYPNRNSNYIRVYVDCSVKQK